MPFKIKELQTKHPNKKIEVWFQDEARVGQHGTLARVWAKTGTRPRKPRDFRFKSVYVFGAICPNTKKENDDYIYN